MPPEVADMANLTAVAESGKWDELRDVEQPTTWMLVTLKAGSKKKLVVDGTGAGGLDEFKAALRDDTVRGSVSRDGRCRCARPLHPCP